MLGNTGIARAIPKSTAQALAARRLAQLLKTMMDPINQNIKLSDKEIKFVNRTIRRQIFPSLTCVLFLFLIVLIYSSLNQSFGSLFILMTMLCAVIGVVVFLIITRKYRIDLKKGQIKQDEEVVEDKIYKLDYEPGSRSLPISILSIFLIKKIAQIEMKEMHIYYILVNGERIDIEKTDFESLEKGMPIIIRRTFNSGLFLGLQPL